MSIYQQLNRPVEPEDVTVPVTRGGASQAPRARPADRESARNWSSMRKAKPVDYLLPIGSAWLDTLPKGIRPLALVTQYPRIANILALEWREPTACRSYFDSLLVDHRGNRQGFPGDVDGDLRRLRHYYSSLHLSLDE
jgi:hypothetical protein